ncbi:hypothetical protein NVP1213O_43 [Vibrio phage 1.213.O._10N.222.54.F10]|nr:hypothetical protein NVP1213O_43 [Vibrio phage 1.213.O._10N.222.54.F10]
MISLYGLKMDSRIERLILDNPNLSTTALCRLTGLSVGVVNRIRVKPLWTHKGKGIPFMCFVNRKEQACHQVSVRGRLVFNGLLTKAIENVDRVIYCLENNNGKLPSKVFDNMGFIGRG